MKFVLSLLATIVAVSQAAFYDQTHKNIVETVNNSKSTWTAGYNRRFENMSHEDIKVLMGAKTETAATRLPLFLHENTEGLPDSFDSREAWPRCESIKEIRDQSHCGSCWAFSAVEAFSDRICIASNQVDQTRISSENLLACCAGWFTCGNGCQGGFPSGAWRYFKSTGVVTGNLYGQQNYCQAYSFQPCDHHVSGSYVSCDKLPNYKTPQCSKECNSQYQGPSYENDKHYASTVYGIAANQEQIKAEIQKNGPVSAAFTVYEDFLSYKSGVYVHKTGAKEGGHAIKIIGWGVEAGTPYWLVANSWNNEWGLQGTFKILRGHNECGIEGQIFAGLPGTKPSAEQIEI